MDHQLQELKEENKVHLNVVCCLRVNGHVQTCSLSSMYYHQVGGWHSTEMPSCCDIGFSMIRVIDV